MKNVEKFYPHLLAFTGFVLIAILYFYPVLQGKQLFQSDIAQYIGMAREQNDFRAEFDAEPYWTNAAFGGMPTYQLGASYPHNYIKSLDSLIRFLPRPADYLFLYFASFYVLMLVLKINPLKAFFGALAFGLSTYLIIILGVGHNAKAHAIAYMPLVVAGVLLVYRRKYIMGGLLTMFAAALEISANHFQMTYYLLLFLLILSVFFVLQIIKARDYNHLLRSVGVFVAAGILALGANATNLMATSEYAKFSTRGKSDLSFDPDGKARTGNSALSREYITEYSYGVAESLNLVVPRLFGGSNSENIGKDSHVFDFLVSRGVPEHQAADFTSGVPAYWGNQPIVAAPAYIGAVVFFLALIALYGDRRRVKYVFLAGAVFALLLSWGKNFMVLTDFFIAYVPLYSSFRAVSSIQVILELCMPALAIMGLQSFMNNESGNRSQILLRAAITCGVLLGILFFMKSNFRFEGSSDEFYARQMGSEFVDALVQDRMTLYTSDILRSFFLIAVTALCLWLYNRNKIQQLTTVVLVGLVMTGDLFFIAKNYVDSKDFINSREAREPFQPTAADLEILKDQGNYRVFEASGNLSSARASYFHSSIGGYHAAKPRRFQDIFDYQIKNNNLEVFNMLNVRYVIQQDDQGREFPVINPDANGNAWFAQSVKLVGSADEEMKALSNFDSKNTAIVNRNEFPGVPSKFAVDSIGASIKVQEYRPNLIKYQTSNSVQGLAVFSEVYYPQGWNAYIDENPAGHIRANYLLRALQIPAGNHTVEFRFEPQVVKTGSMIALVSSLLMLLLVGAGLYYVFGRKETLG
jgi:hypothetical protein